MATPFLACMTLVAAFYDLPPRILPAIHAVEGGRPGLISTNTNGTEDLGVMQINTVWVAPLARQTGLPEAQVRHRLTHEPCFNIATAGAILRTHLNSGDGDLMRAIGNYHSRTPDLHESYRQRVLAAARRLFGGNAPRS